MKSTSKGFSWALLPGEAKKLIPMVIMVFCICFNHTTLRNLKDALIVPENGSGAAIIPFIKVWVIVPAAIIMTIIFTFLSNRLSRRAVFHVMILGFLSFFTLFAFFLYPNRAALEPRSLATALEGMLPPGFHAMVGMLRHWPLTLFYVMSETWGSIVLSVLFWGFANEVTKLSEAPRFYGILSVAACVAPVAAGGVSSFLSQNAVEAVAWEQALTTIILFVIAAGITALLCFNWLTKHALDRPTWALENSPPSPKEKHLSFRESLSYVASSRYLLCIAILVFAYNLVVAIVELVWKDQLGKLCPSPNEYSVYVNNLTIIVGVLSIIASFLFVKLVNRFGWTVTAIITPLALLITTVAFFFCIVGGTTITPVIAMLLGTTPLTLAVTLGSIQFCFSKAAKYSLFDMTKEMAFIPLAPDVKLKGKAAIDGIGSRLGKSGGSCVNQGLYLIFCSVSASVPYVAVVLLLVTSIWLLAVVSLGKQFDAIGGKKPVEGSLEAVPA
jgi:AAA family ATP:ADP antiporter